ncbi:riboflavin biosynthesis protein RibF [Neobacillus sp. NPDC093127]|uniref:riboflavin biosynthesis protein RibF n=1 Tax=Neobacillus sp. NPDC093127 TaxID=3364296 RepID=UPI003828C2EC
METIYIQHPISDSVKRRMESCVIALGFFDGVHKGHQGIMQTAKEIAKRKQLTFAVMTFYPHPRDVVNPNQAPMKYLTPLPIKEERFEQMGVEKLFVVKFDSHFASLSPEDFVNQYIIGLQGKHVVAGFDYHYGHKGKGNMEILAGEGMGKFTVTTVKKIEHSQKKISSSVIRQLLSNGKVNAIPAYLGDFFEVRGEVIQTSLYYKNNQFLKIAIDQDFMTPKSGVYKVLIEIENKIYQGVCHQITLKDNQRSLLVHLPNCFIDTSHKQVKVKWQQYIFGKQKEVYDMSQYFICDELVI